LNDPVAPHTPGEGAEHPIPELLQLGEQLKQARQTAGVSPEDLARRLRIEPRQLQAMEEGDHSRLPEGVFVVALARRMAGALQTDLEEAIHAVRQSRLMRRERPAKTDPSAGAGPWQPSPSVRSVASTARHEQSPAAPSGSRPWRWPVLAALLATCGLAAAWLLSTRQRPGGHPKPAAATSSQAPAPTPASAPPSAPASVAAGPDSLRLIAREPSWIEVREVNGRTLFEGTLTGEKRFPLGRGIEVIAGRPHAVTAAIGPAPAAPLGGVADIRWKRFSPPGLTPPSPSTASPSP
jgi:cytoskeleton protein RodZ